MANARARPLARSEAGIGGRPLMLVHGLTGGRVDFADWMDPLVDLGWHVVAPDTRGHGETGGPDDTDAYTLDHICADLTELAGELCWDRFVLLGHSLGGIVAQQIAIDHAGRLDALVLMDTAHGPVDGPSPEEIDFGMAVAASDGMGALYDLIASLRTGGNHPPQAADERPDLVEQDRAKFEATVPAMFAAGTRILLSSSDRLEQLRRLDVPTLVIVGELDSPFVDDSRRMADAIPAATLAVIPGAGHSPQREAPDIWWAALAAFLGGLDSTHDDGIS